MAKWKKVDKSISNYWKPETPGDQIIGKISDMKTVTGQYGDQYVIVMDEYDSSGEEETGKQVNVTCSAGLLGYMETMVIGETVKIIYCGMDINKSTKRAFKKFDVYTTS